MNFIKIKERCRLWKGRERLHYAKLIVNITDLLRNNETTWISFINNYKKSNFTRDIVNRNNKKCNIKCII